MAFEDDSKHKARAVGPVVLGTSSEKKTPFIEFYFEVTSGDNVGGRARWTGYLHETKDRNGKTGAEKVIATLFDMGWDTEDGDISCFVDGELHGIDTNEMEIVVELESYTDKEGNDRVSPRVKWVNKLGGFLNVQNAMKKEEAQSFGEKMRGLVLKVKAKRPTPSTDATDFNFGANAEPPKQASGAKKGW